MKRQRAGESHVSSRTGEGEIARRPLRACAPIIDRVEFWADALDRLTQPVPEYQATDRLSQHLLPPTAPRRH